MYRAVALKVLRQCIPLSDTERVAKTAGDVRIQLFSSPDGMRVHLDGEDVTSQIRTPEVDRAVGPVCEIPAVRDVLVPQQRSFAEKGNLVTDGRDQGTVVFPDADLKFYLTASLEERTRRRKKDQENKGIHIPMNDLMRDIEERDARDSQRRHSPLRRAEDAALLDTTGMTIDEQVRLIADAIRKKGKRNMTRRFPDNFIYNLVCVAAHPILRSAFGFRVTGAELIPRTGGVIVAVNHASNYDPVLIGMACPRQLAFLAKIELFQNPVLRMLFRRLGAIPLHRGAADSGALRAAVEALNGGKPLLMFPEGTRSKTGELQKGRRGVGMLAVRSGASILPAYLYGSFHMFRNIFRRRVAVHFGHPIEIGPYLSLPISVKELYRRLGEDTMARIKELKNAHYG